MIEINNLTTTPVEEEFIKKVAEKVLESENKNQADLSIAFVGQGKMRKLNKKYRGKNRVTDVLTFPGSKALLEKFQAGPLQKFEGLGEIVICLREVKKNAKRFDQSFEKELAGVLFHGILHLLGYDHEKNEIEAEKMRKKEKNYLSRLI